MDPITRAALEPWVSADTLAQLNISAAASLTLEAERPALDAVHGALTFDRLSLSAARVPIREERPTRLDCRGRSATVGDWTWTGAGASLAVTGGVGLADRRLDLTVKGTSDLRIASAFLSGAATAGTADVDVRVHGPMDDPDFDGQITIAGGELRMRSPRFAVTDVSGTIALARDRIEVGGIGGNANGGLIQIQGELEHDAFTLTGGTLSLVGRRIALDVPEGLRTEVDADLQLDAAGAAPTISGKVTIQRGAYREPIVLTGRVLELLRSGNYLPPPTGEPSALDRVRLNVAVVTASDLVVDDNYGHLRVGTDLRVGGTLGRPALGGRATLREGGQIFLGGNTYQVQQGTVDFVDPNGIKPELNFTAETRVASHDITLNVTGTPDAMKANLSTADGSLGQADIVSLLVTGKTLAEAGTQQTGAAGDQAAAPPVGRHPRLRRARGRRGHAAPHAGRAHRRVHRRSQPGGVGDRPGDAADGQQAPQSPGRDHPVAEPAPERRPDLDRGLPPHPEPRNPRRLARRRQPVVRDVPADDLRRRAAARARGGARAAAAGGRRAHHRHARLRPRRGPRPARPRRR